MKLTLPKLSGVPIGGPHSYDYQPKTKTLGEPLRALVSQFAYKYILRRSSTFVLAAVVGAFAFDCASDAFSDRIFDNYNKGVSSMENESLQITN